MILIVIYVFVCSNTCPTYIELFAFICVQRDLCSEACLT